VNVKEEGLVAIPAKILLETLKNLPDQPVSISANQENFAIEISTDNGKFRLAGEDGADFPKIPNITNGSVVDISTSVLTSAISNTIFATSNDELRQAMTGVYLKFDETNTTFVATDGHRLVRYRRVDVVSDSGHSIIIPRKALNILKTILPAENANVVMEFSSSHIFFRFNQVKMVCRLIDERFPDYENVIPFGNDNEVIIGKPELLGSLKRIAIYANKTTNQVRLKITGSELQVSAEDLDFSNEANERLSCEHQGEDIEIGFNARFLIEMLNNLDTKKVVLKLSEPNKAGLISPDESGDNEDILMLAMPVMLNNYAY
jgi:DNA polymerase-3 subunit beta